MALGAGEAASISTILQDVEYFEATFGSTTAARAKVEAQGHEIAVLRRRVCDLQARLGGAVREAEALHARYSPVALFEHLKREFVCLGGLQLLQQSLARWHEGQAPQIATPPRTVFLAIHETNIPAEFQPAPATLPATRAVKATPIRTPVTEALSARNGSLRAANATAITSRPLAASIVPTSRSEEPAVQPLVSLSSKASVNAPPPSSELPAKVEVSALTGIEQPNSSKSSVQVSDEAKQDAKDRAGEKRKRRRRRKRAQAASAVVSPSDDDDNAVLAPVPPASPSRPGKRARVSVSPTLDAPQETPPPQPASPQSPVPQPPAPQETPVQQTPAPQTPVKAPSAGAITSVECPAQSPDFVRPAYKRSTHIQVSPPPSSPTPSPSPLQEQHSLREEAHTSTTKSDEQLQKSPTTSPTSSTKAPAPSTTSSPSSGSASPTTPHAPQPSHAPRRTRAAAKQAEATAGGVGVKRPTKDVLVKQIIEWPSDRRNLVNMKQSAMFLTLEGIEALEEKEPWNDMFLRRARYSSLIDPETIGDRGLKWLKATLRAQFVLRREFWERLHWLPISETVCVGVEWSKYRKARTRRASYAARVWRKLYEESIELMADGVLRDDVWCDPALWYMPASHVSWLPKSSDLPAELTAEDYENPSRTYFATAPSWHPFYQDERFTEFIEKRYPLPAFSPHQVAAQQEEEEEQDAGTEAGS